jgi:hypothetical protein
MAMGGITMKSKRASSGMCSQGVVDVIASSEEYF